jgi:threonine dehydratase
MAVVTLADIREAARRIAPIAHRTPVLRSRSVDERAGCEVFFKCENFQRGGAYKIRGASNFLYSLTPAERERGVVAFSSGNHAQAVAIAARSLGMRATIVMPQDAPESKVAATVAYGAAVVRYDRQREDREAIGRKIAEDTGATLVPPYDHPWIIAGAGTTALEFLDEVPDLDSLVICIGGGGLLSGSATAAHALRPEIRIFGAEPELANDTFQSFLRGERVSIAPPATIADGLRANTPGALTFPIIKRHAESIILVSEAEIHEAVKFLLARMKILAEPSGAVAAAVVLNRKLPQECRRAGVIISGGNVDWEVLASL